MFQDLNVRYDNTFREEKPQPDSLALIYRGDAVLANMEEGVLTLPTFAALAWTGNETAFRYAFTLGSRFCFLFNDAGGPIPALNGYDFIPSRQFRGMGPKEAVFAAAVGESLHRWFGANRFCGRCGTPMNDSGTERARVCPDCGLTVYPKISPAVIVAVSDGDRLLLTKYRGRTFKRYALVAGFNEIGESIEDTVRREVLEETGVRVKNLRFYKSQPWVFTDSLLMGFTCELDGNDRITIQENELSEAGWYHRDEIPEDYSPISLTGEMIDHFRRGEQLN